MASIAELLLEQGRSAANARRRQGETTAQLIGNLATAAGQTIGDITKERQQAPIRAQEQRLRERQLSQADQQQAEDDAIRALFSGEQMPSEQAILAKVRPERAMPLIQGIKALTQARTTEARDSAGYVRDLMLGLHALPEDLRAQAYPSVRGAAIQRGAITEQDAPAEYDPAWWTQAISFGQQTGAPKTREVKTRNADGSETIQIVEDSPGRTFTSAPDVKPEKTYEVTVRGQNGRPVKQVFTESQMKAGVEEYDPIAQAAKFWVFRDGQPVRISESEYRRGDLPSNTREQGRPVTSGDAGRVADFDTSINDLAALKTAITATDHATGTTAAIGGAMPAWATDLLGWGVDAKKRQGVIDRVKQVIGKTLEGGVLRKEDEYKYEKILPTLKDTPEVAASKLAGLEQAITKRRATFLDALGDAGYEVGKFNARQPSGGRPDPLGIR